MSEPHPPPKPSHITVVRALIGIAVIVTLIFTGREIAHFIPHAEKWIQAQGIWAPVYYILIVCLLTALCVPLDLMLIAAGVIFPLGEGFLIVTIALLISQSNIFWLSRLLLHNYVQRWIARKPKLKQIEKALTREGIKLCILIRMAPVPASPCSYLMGASKLSYPKFLIGTLGLLPLGFVSQYFGYAAAHATTTATNPKHHFSLHDAVVYGGFVVALVVVIMIGHTAKKALQEAGADTD